jgi:hypothetical protein
MPEDKQYNIFLTFDCDPANFDPSLSVLGDPGLNHLEESIPIAIKLLNQVSEKVEKSVKATFFIRNISTDLKGKIVSEPWLQFVDLWKILISEGHGLGLHPHIDTPIRDEEDSNFSSVVTLMKNDFNSLSLLNELSRVTRVGGHAYNELTSKMLRNTNVRLDSSAIPGRKLGKYDYCSDWLTVDNNLKMDWDYPNLNYQKNPKNESLAQLPMTTLKKIGESNYRRYIDFSFSNFEDFSLPDVESNSHGHNVVTISHPSTLLERHYLAHRTLEFGTENWLMNFNLFIERITSSGADMEYRLLREIL